MALQMIQAVLPEEVSERFRKLLAEHSLTSYWETPLAEGLSLGNVVLDSTEAETLMDRLHQHFAAAEGFRLVLLPVEAMLPRPEKEKEAEQPPPAFPPKKERRLVIPRISREALYLDALDSSQVSSVYILMSLLSAIVAANGLLRDSVAIIIGAMVIAPLLGPNVALSLATTLADRDLARRALWANAAGAFTVAVISVIFGLALPVDPSVQEIAARTQVSLADVALALASGAAGALAFTTGVSAALIGVMVAVALVPPLVVFGLLLGSGNYPLAVRAFMLVATNVICVNLAGVTIFILEGIHPRNWWESTKARRLSRVAASIWTVLLGILIALVLYTEAAHNAAVIPE